MIKHLVALKVFAVNSELLMSAERVFLHAGNGVLNLHGKCVH